MAESKTRHLRALGCVPACAETAPIEVKLTVIVEFIGAVRTYVDAKEPVSTT
jgi:hypothetical protein